jgi:hypothetical protein
MTRPYITAIGDRFAINYILDNLDVALSQTSAGLVGAIQATAALDLTAGIATLAKATKTITVPGAVVGSPVRIVAPVEVLAAGVVVQAAVTSANTVTVYFVNATAVTYTASSATLSYKAYVLLTGTPVFNATT